MLSGLRLNGLGWRAWPAVTLRDSGPLSQLAPASLILVSVVGNHGLARMARRAAAPRAYSFFWRA